MAVLCAQADTQGAEIDSGRMRGVLHDVGHELATLRYLLAELRSDGALSTESAHRLRDAEEQVSRIGEIVGLTVRPASPEPISVREVLGRLASVTDRGTSTSVRLLPGPDVRLPVDPTTLWRMTANLVQNATRAAGPAGQVEISVLDRADGVVIDVVDNGPGFGAAPLGVASQGRTGSGLGIGIVADLARDCGARLRIGSAEPRGARARLEFDREPVR